MGVAEFKLSFFYSSSWEFRVPPPPHLCPFFWVILRVLEFSPLPHMEEMFSCCLSVSLPSHSLGRPGSSSQYCLPPSLAMSTWSDTPSLYLRFGGKMGFMPPTSSGTLGKDRGDGCEVLSA